MPRRVVITGIGMVTCLGSGTDLVWSRLLQGRSGIKPLTDPAFSQIPSRVAGLVDRGMKKGEFNLENMQIKCNLKCASTASTFVLQAAHQAIQQSKINLSDSNAQLNTDGIFYFSCNHHTGVAIGNSFVETSHVTEGHKKLQKAYNKLTPHFVPLILSNMTAGLVSIQFNAKGPNHSVATACTTGLHAIGDAFRFVRGGDADVMICGSTEACIEPLVVAGLCRMRALSTSFNENPSAASRPFDAKREGFVISEGACVMVVEELQHALQRSAVPIAEILGYGLSADANHVTAPLPDGDGVRRSMLAALKDAQLQPHQVGHVNAHATSTPLGDPAEAQAINSIFPHFPIVTSNKGAIGHMLGGAGSTEAAFAALSCHHRVVPGNLNLTDLSTIPFPLSLSSNNQPWQSEHKRIAITNSLGFGGTNASLCLSEYIP